MSSALNSEENVVPDHTGSGDVGALQQHRGSYDSDGARPQRLYRLSERTHKSSATSTQGRRRELTVSHFFRSLVGYRRNDYHSDAPQERQQYPNSRRQQAINAANNNTVESNTSEDMDYTALPLWRRFLFANTVVQRFIPF